MRQRPGGKMHAEAHAPAFRPGRGRHCLSQGHGAGNLGELVLRGPQDERWGRPLNDIDHTYWYLTRASGFVAYLLLFACVSLGLSMTGSTLDRWLARYRVYDLHRFLS